MKDVIILGAGIAGLSAGFELSKSNIDFQILESSNKVGGSIETLNIDDFQIETGPNTFTSLNKEIFELVNELEIEDLLQEASSLSKKRYICLNNRLIALPSNPLDFFKSDIISKEAKKTLIEELFIKKEENEETVEDFISRRFGREILKNVIQPFLGGIYAGDVKKLSADSVFPKLKELERKYRSIIWGSIISGGFNKSVKKMNLYSFRDGLYTLPLEIQERLKNKVTLNVKDIDITRAKDFFIVNFKINNKPITYTTNSILFAIPSYKISDYNYLIPKDYITDLTNIEYVPVASVNQTIDKSKIKIDLDGFGFLCVKEPHRKLLGTIWTSSLFPDRAPKDKVLFTSYLGGAHFKKVSELDEDEIKNIVSKDLSETLHISDIKHLKTLHVKVHPHAIPQYNIGHALKAKRVEELMNRNYGLFFTGNYLYGISVNDTIKTSKQTVQKIKTFLSLIKASPFTEENNKTLIKK